ncbi:MAG TPA: DUF3048 domain-containing protein [Actinomycetota bacterium]|jgi:hypothetical protein|nr:DUF3048 domain-containing protein [Actinomycetota bacterium]
MSNLPGRFLVCAAAFALAAAACSSGPKTEVKARPAEPRTVVHPLTGVEYKGLEPWMNRPVLAIKIGNAPPERPQAGLDKADLVYEEIVEGGTTRFMAIFSTNDVQRIGPVRSARKVDPTLLAPLQALFGYSGGAPSTIRVLRSSSGFTDVGVDRESSAYQRDRSRSSPYNLYTSASELWSGHSGAAPAAQFRFLKESADASAGSTEAATDISFAFGGNGSSRVRYVYKSESGRYEREQNGTQHTVEGSEPLTYRNIVVQTVKLSAGYSIDKAGYRTHDIATTGSGEAIVFRGGKAIRGTWQRTSSSEPFRLITTTGRPIALAPGNTIVELLPQGQPVSIAKPAA